MSNSITGTIKAIGQTNQVTATFEKRELVIEVTEGAYSNVGVFEATQDKCGVLDNFQIGQLVKVEFFWSGNTKPWTDKSGNDRYFNSLKIASIALVGAQIQQAAPKPAFEPPVMPDLSQQPESDLPF